LRKKEIEIVNCERDNDSEWADEIEIDSKDREISYQ